MTAGDITYKNVLKAAIDGFNGIQEELATFNTVGAESVGFNNTVNTLTASGTTIIGAITPSEMKTYISNMAVIRDGTNYYSGKIPVYAGGTTAIGSATPTTTYSTLTITYTDGSSETIQVPNS